MDARQKIERCSAKMLLTYPWWASLYLHLEVVENADIAPTMATDGSRLYYNPEFVEKLSESELLAVLMHETAHCALLHPFRCMGRIHMIWNIACDQQVNAILEAEGLTLPPDCVPPGPLDKTAEDMYDENTTQVLKQLDVLSAAGSEGEDGKDGKSRAAGKMTAEDWKQALASARGMQPAGLSRAIEEAVKPKVDWKEVLARFVFSCAKSDARTWTRPSRRYPILPGWKREPAPKLAVCVDTSGSIDNALLAEFYAEISTLSGLSGVTIYVISCDAVVTGVFEPGESLPSSLVGGGGTDFRPAIEKSTELAVEGIVYFTDAAGEFPRNPPPCPVLWLVKGGLPVPWGERVGI